MKATVIAPANIALIKYWGKRDAKLRLPSNPSISMNLSACITTTTVEFSPELTHDILPEGFSEERIRVHIDRLRHMAGSTEKARVITKNTFPTSAGIASSASGFAALTVASAAALGLKLSERKLTEIARLGSGSACRSIPDGFVKWEDSSARSLYPADYWGLRDIVVLVEDKSKDISSSTGHERAHTSPYFQKRLKELPDRIARVEHALKEKDFQALGEAVEEDCLSMHRVMQTQTPALFYWTEKTKKLMDEVIGWRKAGIPVYFTIDAGPNVHLICEAKNEQRVIDSLGNAYQIIVNKPAQGARLL